MVFQFIVNIFLLYINWPEAANLLSLSHTDCFTEKIYLVGLPIIYIYIYIYNNQDDHL